MRSRSQKIRLGIFLSIAFLILFAVLLIVSGSQFLIERNNYFISFTGTSVSGLEIGAPVKYLGVRVGRIDDIRIDIKNTPRVLVKIAIEGNLPIKEDVTAIISMVGITGLKQIELEGGSPLANNIKPGAYIKAGKSFADAVSGKAEIIANKAEKLLNNLLEITSGENKNKLFNLIVNLSNTLQTINTILSRSSKPIQGTIQNVEKSSEALTSLIISSKKTVDSLDKVLVKFSKISADLDEKQLSSILNNLSKALQKANTTFRHIDNTIVSSHKDFIQSISLLRSSLQNINEVSRLLTEDPSILIRGVQGQKRR